MNVDNGTAIARQRGGIVSAQWGIILVYWGYISIRITTWEERTSWKQVFSLVFKKIVSSLIMSHVYFFSFQFLLTSLTFHLTLGQTFFHCATFFQTSFLIDVDEFS